MTLEQAQAAVDDWIKTYGVKYFSEITNMGILTEEVGELARHIVRIYGEQSYKKTDALYEKPALQHEVLAEEMADVLWVLLCIANQTGVSLEGALQKSIEKKTQRDSQRHQNNEKLR